MKKPTLTPAERRMARSLKARAAWQAIAQLPKAKVKNYILNK
jgi:hypothetical protein